ncbi:glycosyltransferase [Sphingobacterium multivorum]|uniref:glycosyltransferase n=1 Tax=Sphingobacterium multivorum TaxID=28454 RepID=UPI002899460C|nr:glycosyltransferase [Sphingobacterium multivorum]
MINICFVDYFGLKTNGINTYREILLMSLQNYSTIHLSVIFLKASDVKIIKKEKMGSIDYYFIEHDIASTLHSKYDLKIVEFLKKQFGNKKNLIFHFNWVNHGKFAQLVRKHINCRTVLTNHCVPWRNLISTNYYQFKKIEWFLFQKKSSKYLDNNIIKEVVAYNSFDKIIAVTNLAKRSLIYLCGIPENKIKVIYNGIPNIEEYITDKYKLRMKHGFREDEILILFAGAVTGRKGIQELIESVTGLMKNNTHIRLVIAGDGNFNEILPMVKSNWSAITFTGNLDRQTLQEFYQMADIGVIPSYVEQCSFTALEMMAFKLPLIASEVDGLSEIIPESCALKIPLINGESSCYIDTKMLSNHIMAYIDSKQTRMDYSDRAFLHVSNYFSSKKMVCETRKIYESIYHDDYLSHREYECLKDDYPAALITVIIPCYNGRQYLKEAIESVLNQSYSNFELLIVNDGSTDDSLEVIKDFSDRRIKVINNKMNLGIVKALNIGISNAGGEYIARLDADDMMHKDRLLKQMQFLQKNKDIDIVGSYHYIVDENGCIISIKEYPISNTEIKFMLFFQNPFSHPSVMFRAHIIKEFPYSSEYKHIEDYILWCNILKTYKGANIPECLTYYRVHQKNVSKEFQNSQRENVGILLLTMLEKLRISPSPNELKIHLAIANNYGRMYFNDRQKIDLLSKWIDKVVGIANQTLNYSISVEKNIKKYLFDTFLR